MLMKANSDSESNSDESSDETYFKVIKPMMTMKIN